MLFFEILPIYKECSKTFVKLLELKPSTIFFTFNKIGIWDQFLIYIFLFYMTISKGMGINKRLINQSIMRHLLVEEVSKLDVH